MEIHSFPTNSILRRCVSPPTPQAVEERARVGGGLPELLQCHGTSDDLVLHQWGEDTAALLKKAGMASTFHSFPGLHHQLCQPEVELLRSWVLTKLPPLQPDP